MTYRVVVRRFDGSEEKVIASGCSERSAERIEMGILRNLDVENWGVVMEPED